MSDLSRLLEDVYRRSQEPAAPTVTPDPALAPDPEPRPAPVGPAPSSNDDLESVFADWTPGPHEEAPAAEHSLFAELLAGSGPDTEPALGFPLLEVDDVLGRYLDDDPDRTVVAVVAGAELPPPAVASIPAEPLAAWRREDDDILPARSKRRTMSLRLRR